MRIATWNVGGLKAWPEHVVRWLDRNQPDVIGLQEARTRDIESAVCAFSAQGYSCKLHLETDEEGFVPGVAILSRHPLEVTQEGLPGQESRGARLLSANTGGLSFTTVYVPTGTSAKGPDSEADAIRRKLGWLDSLLRHLEKQRNGPPAVLCGDFNVTPEPLDTWQHWHQQRVNGRKPGFREDERARLRLLKEAGWFDLIRHSNADGRVFSWWWSRDFYIKDKGLRLDHLLGDPGVASRLRCAWSDRRYYEDQGMTGRPDHAAVIADLAPEPTA